MKIHYRDLQRYFWLFGLIVLALILQGCQPATTSTPAVRPSPLPTVAQQSLPTATHEVPPSPAATPVSTTAATSGLHIVAKIGPTCPGPQRPGQVCERPYEGEFVVTNGAGAEVARVTTAADGLATVDLPSGQYTVAPKVEGRLPSGASVNVTVPAGQYVEVNLELDTGIR